MTRVIVTAALQFNLGGSGGEAYTSTGHAPDQPLPVLAFHTSHPTALSNPACLVSGLDGQEPQHPAVREAVFISDEFDER